MLGHLDIVIERLRLLLVWWLPLVEAVVIHGNTIDGRRLVVEQASGVAAEHVALVVSTNLTYRRSLSRSLSLVNLIITMFGTSHPRNKVQQLFLIDPVILLLLLRRLLVRDRRLLPHVRLGRTAMLFHELLLHITCCLFQAKLVLHVVGVDGLG